MPRTTKIYINTELLHKSICNRTWETMHSNIIILLCTNFEGDGDQFWRIHGDIFMPVWNNHEVTNGLNYFIYFPIFITKLDNRYNVEIFQKQVCLFIIKRRNSTPFFCTSVQYYTFTVILNIFHWNSNSRFYKIFRNDCWCCVPFTTQYLSLYSPFSISICGNIKQCHMFFLI